MVTERDQQPHEGKLLLDHEYDGIRELDNDLPPWWKNLFYLTIIFALVYFAYYEVLGVGNTQAEAYVAEMQAVDPNYEPPPEMVQDEGFQWSYHSPWFGEEDMTPLKRKELEQQIKAEAARMVAAGAIDATATGAMNFDELILLAMGKAEEENLAKLETAFPELYGRFEAGESGAESGAEDAPEAPEPEPLIDDASLAAGKEIYDLNCVPCHGKLGEGGIGPNMTDDYWIHGGRYTDIIQIITVGVPAKGMIAWARTLKPQQIEEVASYIETLRGTDPPNAKAPQGEVYKQDE